VFIFVHGGWWYFLDKSDFSYLATPFVERDAVYVAISYPLVPEAKMGSIVASVEKAVIWIRDNIERYGGDPNRLHIGGHSAGGHLATMMSFNDWTRLEAPSTLLKTNCSVSGLYDLTPVLDTPHNEKIQMERQSAIENSPIRLTRNHGTQFLLSVGGDELSGFHWQHNNFLDAGAKECGQRSLLRLDHAQCAVS
jgi:arylformamidase